MHDATLEKKEEEEEEEEEEGVCPPSRSRKDIRGRYDAATVFVRGDFRATAVAAWFTHLARLPIDANLVHGVHPIVDMSAVSLVNIASPSRVAVERVFAAGRTTASFLPPTPRRSARSVRGTCAAAAAPRDENSGRATFKNPKATSTVVRMAFGELEPTASVPAARKPLAETLGAIAQTLWGLRRGAVMLAFALGLALVDAGPALAGRGGRSGGRMGGSSFRSTSARSMGAGAAGAGAAGAQRQPMGMGGPRFLFMPSFGPFGYGMGMGYGMGPMYVMGSVLRLLINVWLMFMVYQFLFGGRRNGNGGDAAY